MEKYIAEVCFGDRTDLPVAIQTYNAKANKFQCGLHDVEIKYHEYLMLHQTNLGVETIDNFDNCTIKLKLLSGKLSEEITLDVIQLFNTIWSQ